MPTLAELKAALTDPAYYRQVGGGLLDAYNRGAVGGLLGTPVDMANGVLNAGKMAAGYIGHQTGLLSGDQMPQPDMMPVGGSEWIGQKMQDAGMVSPIRNMPAEMLAGLAGIPLTAMAAAKTMPAIEGAAAKMANNATAQRTLNTPAYGGQRGAAGGGVDILSNEISAARDAARPRSVTLPNGTIVNITPTYSEAGGAVSSVSANTGRSVLTYPTGYIPRDSPVYSGMSADQIRDFYPVINKANAAKRDLVELKAARDYVTRTPDPAPLPAKAETVAHAGPEWWQDQLGIGGPKVASKFLGEAAKTDDFFLYGKPSAGASIDEIVNHYSNKSGVPLEWNKKGKDLVISNPKTGEEFNILGFDTSKPVIRSIDMKQGSGTGKPAYQAGYSILDEAGKKAYPDTGITNINDYRKISNVLAGDLRAGRQVAVMNSSKVGKGNPTPGEMLIAEAKETALRAPEVSGIGFDGSRFVDTAGKTLSDSGIFNMLKPESLSQGVGPMAAKRAAVAQYLEGLSAKEAAKLGGSWKNGSLLPAMLAIPTASGLLSEEQVRAR